MNIYHHLMLNSVYNCNKNLEKLEAIDDTFGHCVVIFSLIFFPFWYICTGFSSTYTNISTINVSYRINNAISFIKN